MVAKTYGKQVRIIAGKWRRTPLTVIEAEGLRPTPDRVRETLFNWLNHDLACDWSELRALDVFAGTGALGLEAASRGAKEVIINELNPKAYTALEKVLEKLKADNVKLMKQDAHHFLDMLSRQKFDLVFLDPPFGADWLSKILPKIYALLNPNACVYVESELPIAELYADLEKFWCVKRSARAGAVYYHILEIKKEY